MHGDGEQAFPATDEGAGDARPPEAAEALVQADGDGGAIAEAPPPDTGEDGAAPQPIETSSPDAETVRLADADGDGATPADRTDDAPADEPAATGAVATDDTAGAAAAPRVSLAAGLDPADPRTKNLIDLETLCGD